MPDYSFLKPIASPTETEAVSVQIQQSATIDGEYLDVGIAQTISLLGDDPDDPRYSLISEPLADESYYTRILFYTASGSPGLPGIPLAPTLVAPTETEIVVNLSDWGDTGQIALAGAELSVTPVGVTTVAGWVNSKGPWEGVTDINGHASVIVPRGITVNVSLHVAGIANTTKLTFPTDTDLIDILTKLA